MIKKITRYDLEIISASHLQSLNLSEIVKFYPCNIPVTSENLGIVITKLNEVIDLLNTFYTQEKPKDIK